jgi:hypothetical protein
VSGRVSPNLLRCFGLCFPSVYMLPCPLPLLITFPRLALVADCVAETVNQDKIFCVHKNFILPRQRQWRKTCVIGCGFLSRHFKLVRVLDRTMSCRKLERKYKHVVKRLNLNEKLCCPKKLNNVCTK